MEADAVTGVDESTAEDEAEAEDEAAVARRAYAFAIRVLGDRDHSTAELTRKLGKKGFDESVIGATLVTLCAANYVDDCRYAATLVAQMAEKRRGPLAIRAKLRERGIDAKVADTALGDFDTDWAERAACALAARFDRESIVNGDRKMQARVARFLQGRGFSAADSIKALRSAGRDLDE